MNDDFIALALLKAYADAAPDELTDWGVTRDELLALARSYIDADTDAKLARAVRSIINAYVAGKRST